jgi:hypothetical protein
LPSTKDAAGAKFSRLRGGSGGRRAAVLCARMVIKKVIVIVKIVMVIIKCYDVSRETTGGAEDGEKAGD